MLFSLLLAIVPHIPRLPVPITAFCLLFGIWRFMHTFHAWPLPGQATRILLCFLTVAGIFLSYGTIFGKDAGIAFLTILLALKLLEMRQQRDLTIAIFLGFFQAITIVLYQQTLVLALYLIIPVMMLLTTLIVSNQAEGEKTLMTTMKYAANLTIQSLPVMLLFFVLFPRIQGPLWGLPNDAYNSMTGLDDKMSLGTLGRLGQSDSMAFRVMFEGPLPDKSSLYWRGPVLWHSDGETWTPNNNRSTSIPASDEILYEGFGQPVEYSVTLEPHNRNWLFALDLPASLPENSILTSDIQLTSTQPIRTLTRYKMSSYLNYRTSRLHDSERRRALQLPAGINPRTQALGRQLKQRNTSDAAVIQQALRYFNEQPFYYTLEPPPLQSRDKLDEFLFSNRRGFCEHYSAAFATLMRAAGIPTRIVTGYQGGNYNPVGHYLMVRQKDAHAWVEVWLDGSGWVRFDPTASVAPERVERGIDSVELDSGRRFNIDLFKTSDLIHNLRYRWDAINYKWNQWILGYDKIRQTRLLNGFGIHSFGGMLLWLALGLISVIVIIGYLLACQQRPNVDPVKKEYQRFCNKLARCGLIRNPGEGPEDFAKRAIKQNPELENQINAINQLYVSLQYGKQPPKNGLRLLHRQVKEFSHQPQS